MPVLGESKAGLGQVASGLDLDLLEAGSITEALVLGLGVNPEEEA